MRAARREGYRSRAAYKLLELDAGYRLLRPGMSVLDLGASPGGWTQVAAAKVGSQGQVVAVDRLSMKPVDGVRFIQADLDLPEAAGRVVAEAGGRAFDLVVCDIAPNITGVRDVDEQNFLALSETVGRIHRLALRPRGRAVTKMFQGGAFEQAVAAQREMFGKVAVVRSGATKRNSREVYLMADGMLHAALLRSGK